MRGEEKCDLLIQVTAWAGYTVLYIIVVCRNHNLALLSSIMSLIFIVGSPQWRNLRLLCGGILYRW